MKNKNEDIKNKPRKNYMKGKQKSNKNTKEF